MDTKTIIIIVIISIILLGGIYYTWQYFTKKPVEENKLLENTNTDLENPLLEELTNQDIHYEDTNAQPYFDIDIGDEYAGRVVMQLFDEEVPKLVKLQIFMFKKFI